MVRFDNFQQLDPDAVNLARELVGVIADERSAFSSFSHAWMAFNGWMECVSEEETDAAMLNALADHPKLVTAYEDLLGMDATFADSVAEIAALLPVLSVRDVRRKLGRDAFSQYERPQLLHEAKCAGVKQQPRDWTSGTKLTWPELLRTIYLVRCNLFHGAKSPRNDRDRNLVHACDKILRLFIERTQCFTWHD
ncbi:MAG: hypothetical protein KF800_07875 [Lysobacter sp.]|nr:hypothetical protein [Lysobacter sp.]